MMSRLTQEEKNRQQLLIGETNSRYFRQLKESFFSVLPIFLIVLSLSLLVAPVPSGTMLCFLLGAALLTGGSALFNMGAEFSMTPIGEKIGAAITKSRKLALVILVGFAMGFAVTVAEPDLQVLAEQVPSIPSSLLIYGVAAGVGVFLVIALLRMIFQVPLNRLLVFFYALILVLAFLVPEGYQAISFDAGGVTTGPMTVPFIMALGVGVASIRNDKNAEADSFGLVSLCSIGPILVVMILGILPSTGTVPILGGTASQVLADTADEALTSAPEIHNVEDTVELCRLYYSSFPEYLKEMLSSLLPIVAAFLIFQLVALHIKKAQLIKIFNGLIYTYAGLVLFMTGVNLGFLPMGYYLGQMLTEGSFSYLVIPAAVAMGYVCVRAEPAVAVLNRQVEEITDGAISAELMGKSLSIGVGISLGLSMIRVLTGISILWFVIPGYSIAILISFFVPRIYTAIAFDSGGVASGPMTAAFLLPFAQGVCSAVGGNIATDAFGVVALVALTPLITIQTLGIIAKYKLKDRTAEPALSGYVSLDDNEIVEL